MLLLFRNAPPRAELQMHAAIIIQLFTCCSPHPPASFVCFGCEKDDELCFMVLLIKMETKTRIMISL